jgi:O-antigen/teichoic acid export membrane protein
MRGWLDDGPLRSVIRSAGQLGTTKILGALFSVAALSLAGRALGPAGFGLLVLIHTWALGANALTNFQSWQVVVRYGSPALARQDEGPARDAISLSLALDISSGLVGMLGAVALLPLAGPSLGLKGDHILYAMAYATIIPSMASATPTGTLRMLGRFDLMAMQQPVTPIVRCLLAFACWHSGTGIGGFLVAWYVADLAGDCALWMMAVHEAKTRGLASGLRPSFKAAARLPGAWRFVLGTNASTTLGACWGPVGNIVIGMVLGPAAAGVYKVAATIVDAAGKPADMLTKGFYPEIMRHDPRTPEPWRLGIRSGVIAGAIGVLATGILLVASPFIVTGLFGSGYAGATLPLSIMTLSLAVSMACFPLQSLLYLADRQADALKAQAKATAVYLITLAPLCLWIGLAGAACANLVATLAGSALMAGPVLSAWRRLTGRRVPTAANDVDVEPHRMAA